MRTQVTRSYLLVATVFSALLLGACVKHPTEPKEPPTSPDSCCNGVLLVLPYDSLSGAVVVGASVRVQKQQGDYNQTKVSDQGGALFTGLCPGTYALRIAREHCAVRELTITLECNEVATLRIPLRCENAQDSCCHGIISVSILDSLSMTPPPSATVRLWRNGTIVEQQQTRQGAAAFDGLCAGEYVLEILAEGYQPKELPVRLECNAHVGVRVLLSRKQQECCNGVLELVVRDSLTNEPIPGAVVRLWREGRIVAEARTNDNGVARFAELCKGAYGISVHAEGYNPKELTVELGCNQAKGHQIFLSQRQTNECCNGSITLIVRDADTRQPVAQATVRLWVGSTVIATKSTNGDGRTAFERLCEGRYAISIQRDGYRGYEQIVELGCNEAVTLEIALQKRE
jgi:hypothetical protein